MTSWWVFTPIDRQVRAWIVPMPGEFHAAEAAHLVAGSDINGDQILTKEEVVEPPKYL